MSRQRKNPGTAPGALTTIGIVFRRNLEADAGTPWWNDRAIRYLGQHVRPGDGAFEWGSGASTAWLVSRGADVTSIEHAPDEHSPDWYQRPEYAAQQQTAVSSPRMPPEATWKTR